MNFKQKAEIAIITINCMTISIGIATVILYIWMLYG